MKKLLALVLPFFFFAFCCTPYQEPALPPPTEKSKVEYIQRPPPGLLEVFDAAYEAFPEIHDINILIVDTKSTALAAVSCIPGQCTLKFNSEALLKVHFYFGTAPIIWILGHELGHIPDLQDYISNDYEMPHSDYELELRADRIGGCILKRLGFEDLRYMDDFMAAELHQSSTHPDPESRFEAMLQGYQCQ